MESIYNTIFMIQPIKHSAKLFQSILTRNACRFAKEAEVEAPLPETPEVLVPRTEIEEKAADHDRQAKEKLVENVNYQAQVLVTEGWYKLEYYHTFGSNDKIALSNGSVVTAKSSSNQFYIKRHVQAGVSLYETIKENTTNKWVKATRDGNTLVSNESEATWFQVLGVGSHYVFQYVNPGDPTASYQWGVRNGPIGSKLKLENSTTELFKLVKV